MRVVVDWRNSLEKDGHVPEVADVHVLPYANSRWKEGQVYQDVRDQMRATHRLAAMEKQPGVNKHLHCCRATVIASKGSLQRFCASGG